MRNLWKVGLAVAVLTVGLGTTAQAQYGIGAGVYSRGIPNFGNRSYGYNNYVQPRTTYYGGGGFGYNNYNYNSYYRAPVYHDTTHYDFHPGGYVPHGNHYHYVPGHYDLHRTGHYHW